MIATIVVDNNRVKPLVDQMGDKVKIIRPSFDEAYMLLEVTIDESIDVLHIFHAGIKYGMDRWNK
jgi:hypothetical protein